MRLDLFLLTAKRAQVRPVCEALKPERDRAGDISRAIAFDKNPRGRLKNKLDIMCLQVRGWAETRDADFSDGLGILRNSNPGEMNY